MIKSKRVISADEMRSRVGLQASQALILLLFDRDELLEDMWSRQGRLIWQISEARYDAVVSPSFSTYEDRSRTEFLINVKRSMLYFEALQQANVPAIPRVAWNSSFDARRFASWARSNPDVETVAIDWTGSKGPRIFAKQLEGLAIFDDLTGQRLTYLINGLSRKDRCEAAFGVVAPDRLHVTNSTTQARIPPGDLRRLRSVGDQTGRTFAMRCAIRRGAVEDAIETVNHARADDEAA